MVTAAQRLNSKLGDADFVDARTRESLLRGDRQKQIIEIEGAKLLKRSEALSAFCKLANEIRTRMLAVPSACATEANPLDPKQAQAIIMRYVKDALASFTEEDVQRILLAGAKSGRQSEEAGETTAE